jgi:hypothetical protein
MGSSAFSWRYSELEESPDQDCSPICMRMQLTNCIGEKLEKRELRRQSSHLSC